MNKKNADNIYDIARLASVSIATVSRVLSGSAQVSEKTRKKVLDVVQETGYTPNAFARGLGLGSMRMVGILCTDVSDLFYACAVSTLERKLGQKGLDVLLYCTGEKLQDKKNAITLLLAKHVDAILLVGSAFKEQADNSHIEQAAKQVPIIIINGLVECQNTYCVLCDEQKAVCENVVQLFTYGCRNILYLYDANTYSGMQKLSGYNMGLEQCQIAARENLVQRVGHSIKDSFEAVSQLVDSGQDIDAVLASEDILAIGASKAMVSLGKSVPIIGFNNSVLCECASPSITSVDNMSDTLCSTAVHLLSEVMEGKTPPAKTTITARLVMRETFNN